MSQKIRLLTALLVSGLSALAFINCSGGGSGRVNYGGTKCADTYKPTTFVQVEKQSAAIPMVKVDSTNKRGLPNGTYVAKHLEFIYKGTSFNSKTKVKDEAVIHTQRVKDKKGKQIFSTACVSGMKSGTYIGPYKIAGIVNMTVNDDGIKYDANEFEFGFGFKDGSDRIIKPKNGSRGNPLDPDVDLSSFFKNRDENAKLLKIKTPKKSKDKLPYDYLLTSTRVEISKDGPVTQTDEYIFIVKFVRKNLPKEKDPEVSDEDPDAKDEEEEALQDEPTDLTETETPASL